MHTKHNIFQLSYWSQTWALMPVRQRKIFGVIILVHLVLTAFYISKQGVIFDEPDYFTYVFQWAKGHPERDWPIMDSKTPMMAISLIPVLLKPFLPDHLLRDDVFFYLKAGRPFMYVFQLLGAFTVCCWMQRTTGRAKWIIPFLFYCFDPLVFSYGMFIGSDLPTASLLITMMYTAWRYALTGNRRYWFILCTTSALGVVTKASMIYCYPLLMLLFGYVAIKNSAFNGRRAFLNIVSFAAIQLIIVNLAYYGKGSFTPFGNLHFTSHLLGSIQASAAFLSNLPVPFPQAFIQGFDLLQHNAEIGGCNPASTYNGIWLFGKLSCDKPVWYYYIVNAAVKMPLMIWFMFLLFAWRLIVNKGIEEKIKSNIFLWVPFVFFFLILSFVNKFQIGIRHAIILLPFFYIALSSTFNWLYQKNRLVFYCLVLLHMMSVIRYWPNLIAYTNELVWNKTKAYKIIRDSSLDYGQSIPWVQTFVREHPGYKLPTNLPDTGKFAITVGHLFSDREGPLKNIAWLRENFEPVDNYRYTILLFNISAADLKAKGLIAK